MTIPLSEHDLEAYLDEALPVDDMAKIEKLVRQDPQLVVRLSSIHSRRDAGVHTLGEIWRRHHLSCPARDHLGSFLLGTLSEQEADYIHFHLDTVGCRCCRANLDDLKSQQAEARDTIATRRSHYFQSSAGYLRRK